MHKTNEHILNLFKYSESQFSNTFMQQYCDPIVWNKDIGYLPGSVMKFHQNKLGIIQLKEDDDALTQKRIKKIDEIEMKQESIQKNGNIKSEQILHTIKEEKKEDMNDYNVEDNKYVDDNCQHKNKKSNILTKDVQINSNGSVKKKESITQIHDDPLPRNGVRSPPYNTSSYGRKRKRKILDGEVVGLPAKIRRERYDRDSSGRLTIVKFDWFDYLKSLNGLAIPKELFEIIDVPICGDKFDFNTTEFQVNQKLEGIDPQNESLFCVLTIAEVLGHRLRLHFDGYAEQFDFWILDNSQLIFPVGWCEKHHRRLQPPKDYADEFNWSEYLSKTKSQAAPSHCFSITRQSISSRNKFQAGYKLEAVDKRNQCMICVATVHDVIGNHVLVHFDSWDPSYDMWAHYMSPLLQPVGYCEDNEKVLSVPSSYGHDLSSFNWESYLQKTHSSPVPKECFEERQQWWFDLDEGMRCELIDRRCPQLIRVAHISKIDDEFQLTFSFDDWSEKYNIKVDLSCSWPQFFPIGWVAQFQARHTDSYSINIHNGNNSNGAHHFIAGHELQPPPTYDASIESSACSTYGCKGFGHVKGPKYSNHQRLSGCPYADCNLNKDLRTDRISSTIHQNHILSPSRPGIQSTSFRPQLDCQQPIQPPSDLQIPPDLLKQPSPSTPAPPPPPHHPLQVDIPQTPTCVSMSSPNTLLQPPSQCEPMDLSMKSNSLFLHHQIQDDSSSLLPQDLSIDTQQHSNILISNSLSNKQELEDLPTDVAIQEADDANETTVDCDLTADDADDPIFLHPPGDGITPEKATQTQAAQQQATTNTCYPSSLSLFQIQLSSQNSILPKHKFYQQPRAPHDLLPNPSALVPSSVLRPNPALITIQDYSYCSLLLEKQITLQILPQILQAFPSSNDDHDDGAGSGTGVGIKKGGSGTKKKAGGTRKHSINIKKNHSINTKLSNGYCKEEHNLKFESDCPNNINEWNCSQVSDYVKTLIGTDIYGKAFIEHEVDGSAFLCLKQIDLIKIVGMKLGPAIKVATTIQYLRQNQLLSSTKSTSNVPTSHKSSRQSIPTICNK